MSARIGELNGRWAALLKVTLVAVPCVTSLFMASFVPWAVWVTGNIYTSQQMVRIVADLNDEMKAADLRMDRLPPDEWKARIVILENESKVNREDHATIKINLAEIKAGQEQIKIAVGADLMNDSKPKQP